jgi:hypothetical protein
MTVFIAYAPKDAPAAEALEKYLERRGLFVERETGERGFRIVQPRDAVVVLWSRDSVFSPHRLQMERRALDAWADQQLILVKLDAHVAPVGLRDLSAIDAAFEPQREIAFAAVAKAALDIQMGTHLGPAPPQARPPGEAEETLDHKRSAPEKRAETAPPAEHSDMAIGAAVLIAIPAGAFLALGFGLHNSAWPLVFSAAAVAGVWQLAKVIRPAEKTGAAAPPQAKAPHAPPPSGAAFVSYAHADAAAVLPVVDAVAANGKPIWIDREGIQAGEGWAGEIVRAIKGAGGVVIMCSAKAFESDHVRREIYLADRYKKPMLPVFLEEVAPPEDFEYFFAGVQWLKLFEAPEAERAAALARAWPGAKAG